MSYTPSQTNRRRVHIKKVDVVIKHGHVTTNPAVREIPRGNRPGAPLQRSFSQVVTWSVMSSLGMVSHQSIKRFFSTAASSIVMSKSLFSGPATLSGYNSIQASLETRASISWRHKGCVIRRSWMLTTFL